MSLCKSGNIVTLPAILHQDQGGAEDAQNLSAQEETETEGTRFQKENGYSRRQKRTQEKTRQRQKKSHILIKTPAQKIVRGEQPTKLSRSYFLFCFMDKTMEAG